MTDNAKTAAHIHALFCAGKLEAVLDLATDDIEVQLTPTGQTFRGREGFMQFMHVFKTAFPDIQIKHTNAVCDGDQVVVEATWNATHGGPLLSPAGTIPATGKRVAESRICEVMKFRGGKLAKLVNYQDFGSWLRQLGLA